ncbi:uncharacterized protein LOC117322984 [Pecten maximus]|uniref:uncharacterized protein LOC117322984 n=1 Tax=Pecten maximus TaxID=6579 RepID=UPI001457F2D1|nr:uncharacterized protein LOC117322984 [Pecten maximus]
MSTREELILYGKELGLQGQELRQFVSEEQAKARHEREEDRRVRLQELEEKEKERLFQKEMLMEKAKLERESEARAIEEHKRQMELQASQSKPTVRDGTAFRGPKLPAFEEGKDNMDAYLQRFERYATAQKWDSASWGGNLSALLKGKALDVFSRLPVEQALKYEELKKALLRRFEKTEEGFRKAFHSARPESGETFSQFSLRLENYFERWVEMTGTQKTYEGVMDLVIRDQFIYCCGRDLALFLKERIPKTLEETAKLADQFADARGSRSNLMTTRTTKHADSKPQQNNSPHTGDNSRGKSSLPLKERKCYSCGKPGHLSYECRGKKSSNVAAVVGEIGSEDIGRRKHLSTRGRGSRSTRSRSKRRCSEGTRVQASSPSVDRSPPTLSESCNIKMAGDRGMPIASGYVGDHFVTVLRDSGCSGVVVRKDLVDPSRISDRQQVCSLADGSRIQVPVAELEIDTPYFRGTTDAWVLETPLYDLIIGNVHGARPPNHPDNDWQSENGRIQAVETRSQKKRNQNGYRALQVKEVTDIGTMDEIKEEQKVDPTLSRFRDMAKLDDQHERQDGGVSVIFYHKGLLYRKFRSPKVANGKEFRQLVVPRKFRQAVLDLAHASIMAGHQGVKRTTARVLSEFFWPGVQADVTRYCRSCDICQRTISKGRVPVAPLGNMPLIDTPFKRVAVDLIGPIQPATYRGNRYILTVVDYATRYPEAVALRGIETEQVAEALVDIFSRVGVPAEMLSDQGAQFTSGVMREVARLLSMKQLTTTPYHPMCNGLVERFNGTLKQMLRRMSAERPKDWDKFINALLFAYREVPQESLGFSPFELLYGRSVRGPMMVLKELWTKNVPDEEVKSTYQYVMDLRERLEETCQLAKEHLKMAKGKQKKYFNRKSKVRQLKAGDKVLVLLPTKANKLLMQWRGPFQVVERVGPSDYRVNRDGKIKTLHVNLLKKYVEPEVKRSDSEVSGILGCIATAVLHEDEDDYEGNPELETLPSKTGKEGVDDVVIAEELTSSQLEDVNELLHSYTDVLTDMPGHTNLAQHDIHTTTSEPVRVKQYPLPYSTKEVIMDEVKKMIDMKIIEPSESPYAAPVVMVKKKDGSNRFCIDFRRLNRVTVFDAEPMPDTNNIFGRLAGARYFSKLDLSKGYWQVPMAEDAKPKTAFSTPQGLFQFRVMPFGLVNAPATFSRLMRKLLAGMDWLDNFIDDILIFTETWEQHLEVLKELFGRLRKARLTARPTKCSIGFMSLPCLGYVVGDKRLRPDQEKIKAIEEAPKPETKKQVRSFLGLASFYRRFIPNFSAIAIPLSDLTKKGLANKVEWNDSHEKAFVTLKMMLTSSPVLKLPDLTQEFILRTDASDTGIGAILLQEENDKPMPVAYASRKLLPREKNYAIIERECLAIVWGIQKFEPYLYGREFVLETDHQPLTYLNRTRTANGRLMRWALMLQPYRFRLRAIKGCDNVGADYLSRM